MISTLYREPASYETHLLDPRQIRLSYSPLGALQMTLEDTISYRYIKLRRSFPLSAENTLISVRDGFDEREREIGLIADVAELEPASRTIAVQALERHYFVPRILVIKSVKNEFGFLYWDVDTDRGPRTFPMPDSYESVIEVTEARIVLTDADGARYEVPDLSALDKRSRELIQKNLFL